MIQGKDIWIDRSQFNYDIFLGSSLEVLNMGKGGEVFAISIIHIKGKIFHLSYRGLVVTTLKIRSTLEMFIGSVLFAGRFD